MSFEKAFSLIEDLMGILNKAKEIPSQQQNQGHSQKQQQSQPKQKQQKQQQKQEKKDKKQKKEKKQKGGNAQPQEKVAIVKVPTGPFKAISDIESVKSGEILHVTPDLSLLEKEWKASELGPNDDKNLYCNCIGLVTEVEEDDDTVQLRWENYDTCYIPVKACQKAPGFEPTTPALENDWLPPEKDAKEAKAPAKKEKIAIKKVPTGPFKAYKDIDSVKNGQTVHITPDLALLEKEWQECGLGPNDDKNLYCDNIGLVTEVEEDDDTVQVRWENYDTCYIPVKACQPAPGYDPTSPALENDWLPPEQEEKAPTKKEEKIAVKKVPTGAFKAYKDIDSVKNGQTVHITPDLSLLEKEWQECGLGPNDDKNLYCDNIGLVTEVEEDDDTVQVRWENYDTCYIPIRACQPAPGYDPTSPALENDWLPPEKDAKGGKTEAPTQKEEKIAVKKVPTGAFKAYKNTDSVKNGDIVHVTPDLALLEKEWQESGLGPNDDKNLYCDNIGLVTEVEEDDDTLQLRWENYDTCYIPVKACQPAPGFDPTSPALENNWLPPTKEE